MSNFSPVLIVFHCFCTCIALGDTDLHFSLIFIPKANDDKGGITRATSVCYQYHQSIHVIDDMTVTSLSASLQHKTAATFSSWQITLNQTLSRKFERWHKFSSHINTKLHKKGPAYI
jgi:hypothetical protein